MNSFYDKTMSNGFGGQCGTPISQQRVRSMMPHVVDISSGSTRCSSSTSSSPHIGHQQLLPQPDLLMYGCSTASTSPSPNPYATQTYHPYMNPHGTLPRHYSQSSQYQYKTSQEQPYPALVSPIKLPYGQEPVLVSVMCDHHL